MPKKSKVRIRSLKASQQGVVEKGSKRRAIQAIVQLASFIEVKARHDLDIEVRVGARRSDAGSEHVYDNQDRRKRVVNFTNGTLFTCYSLIND